VVRGAKRAYARKSAPADPGDPLDAGDLEGLVVGERRQDSREPAREHRLAGAGRADHQQAVSASGGDLQRPASVGLSAHVPQVGQIATR
jgi:hypothetical protein